jgi:NADH-quinone oxidoreductase subunit E
MLNDQEKADIQEHLRTQRDARAAVGEALMSVQRRRGWVSDEAVADVARLLELTADEVDSIATAHNLIFRQPVGRHVILLCDGASCQVAGYDRLREHLTARLGVAFGQTTADGRFTLLPTACLGACEQAPAMMIDQDLHGDLTAEKLDLILGQYE